MSFESQLRTDILPEALKLSPERLRIIVETQFDRIVSNAVKSLPTQTPLPAKTIVEVMDVIDKVIKDFQVRERATEDSKIKVLYKKPDKLIELESITMEVTKRQPGMFGQGRPWENDTRNLRPLLRQEIEDPDNPGYKRAVLGYFHDNELTLTCWARTAKQANERALWLEDLMEDYSWFFVYSGVNRLIYQGRGAEQVQDIQDNKIYGRPIKYFVRTEKLRAISQKEIEEIVIRLSIGS